MIKRIIDIFVSLCILVLFFPLLAIVSGFIAYNLGYPFIFSQVRPGLMGKPFRMIKFRTMLNLMNPTGQILPDEQRLTRFGCFLRKTSLDELPELWNVLKGEMSLVGPRPLLMEYLPLYTTEQMQRHRAKPGITGWAQINGRNTISWKEKFQLDLWYVNHQSFWLDVKIIFLTIKCVLKRDGVNAENDGIMPMFRGEAGDGL